MSSSSSEPDPLDQLAEEFIARCRRGERPAVSEYVDKHPELAERIRDLFPALLMMEEFGSVGGERTGPVAPKASDDGPVPRQLGEYRILRQVGRGGMGTVYEAVQQSLGRHVALKVLPFHAALAGTQRERFRREAQAAARLHHSNIVPVFGVGEDRGVHYYAMQFIQGQSLDAVLEELKRPRSGQQGSPLPAPPSRSELTVSVAQGLLTGQFAQQPPAGEDAPADGNPGDVPPAPASPTRKVGDHTSSGAGTHHSELTGPSVSEYFRGVARVGLQVAEALEYAHRHGILHRDIKPSNLLLDTQGVVWVTDFGLAKADDSDELTTPGDIVGTVRYMAPDRFEGRGDPRSDVYSLGATLYELLVLRPAFEDANRARLVERVLHEDPVRPGKLDPHIPRDLETIVLKALAKDPAGRYQTAGDMAEDLRRFLADRPVRARRSSAAERTWRWCRRNPAVAGLVATVLVLLAAVAVVASVGYAQTRVALRQEAVQRADAEHEREVARTAQAETTDKAARFRRLLYDSDMQLAARLWQSETGTARVVAELLEAHIPGPGEEDVRDFTWRYQWRLLHDPPAFKLENPILVAASAPGGDVVTYDGSRLCFWDRTTCRETGRRSQATLPNRCCWLFSPDGTLLAVGTTDGRVQLYDTATGHERSFLQGAAPLKDVCFSADGRKLATIHADRQARTWEVATGKELATFALRSPSFRDCALSPDGQMLALANHPAHSQVGLYRGGRAEPAVLQTRGVTVGCVAFSPDGRTLASGDFNNCVDLWDAATGQLRDRFTPHLGELVRLAFSPDGTQLGTGSVSGFASVWDLARRQRLFLFKAHTTAIADLGFSADGQSLVATSADGTARLWQLTTPESRTLVCPDATLSRVAFSPDGKWLAVTRPLTLWDARTGVLERRLDSADSVAFSPDGKTLASGGSDSRVRLWDLETRRLLRTLDGRPREPNERHRVVGSLAFSPDGKWLAAGFGELNWRENEHDQVVKVWDLASGLEAATLPHRNAVPSLAFSPDGATLATACNDKTVRLWAVGSWQLLRSWKGSETFDALAFAPGGKMLATGSGDGTVQLWDAATGQALRVLGGHSHRIFDLAFSPDGKTLASASADQTVKLWDVVSGRELRTLAGHTNWVFGVAFAPGGECLASCCTDGMVRLWDTLSRAEFFADWLAREPQPDGAAARAGRARACLALDRPDKALAEAVKAVEFEPGDGELLTLRGHFNAHCGKWAEAANDFETAARLGVPSQPAWLPWYRQAVAHLAGGNTEAYRKACAHMVERFNETEDAEAASFTAWTCALRPDAVPDYAPVLRLAEKVPAKEQDQARSRLAVGAVLYRMGRADEALSHLSAAETLPNSPAMASPAYWRYFLAVAHHRLGHPAEARKWLEKAVAQADTEVRAPARHHPPVVDGLGRVAQADTEVRAPAQETDPARWVRKSTLEMLRAEAEALLRGGAAAPGK
jgi:WD40 repeat protein/serine/threonine protein kinase